MRFKFYKSRKQVKMENKFAALPLTVPLSSSMEQAYSRVSGATKCLKSSMGILYASYAISFWLNKLFPRCLATRLCVQLSDKFTIAVSNTPGALKKFEYHDKDTGEVMQNQSSRSYIMVTGNLGMAVCVYSQVDKLYMSFTSDDAMCDREMNKRIMDLITRNIVGEIERMVGEKRREEGVGGGGGRIKGGEVTEVAKVDLSTSSTSKTLSFSSRNDAKSTHNPL